jgi:DeoR/GlpR family transcriptional regulator of sugar metabolism
MKKDGVQPERLNDMANVVRENRFVTVEDLSRFFKVSTSTIRRDLTILEEDAVIERFHGGAVAHRLLGVLYSEREKKNLEEKRKIGAKAASLIEENSTIILDAGTTVMQVARSLESLSKKNITIITTTVSMAELLLGKMGFKVILSGGVLSVESNSLVGVLATEAFSKMSANKAFLGCEAISAELDVMYPDLEIIEVKKAIMRSGEQKVLVVNSSKFGKVSLSTIGKIDIFDVVITDNKIPEEYLNKLKKLGVNLIIAE